MDWDATVQLEGEFEFLWQFNEIWEQKKEEHNIQRKILRQKRCHFKQNKIEIEKENFIFL